MCGDILFTTRTGRACNWSLVGRGQEDSNIMHCTGQPLTTKNYSAKMSVVLKLRNSAPSKPVFCPTFYPSSTVSCKISSSLLVSTTAYILNIVKFTVLILNSNILNLNAPQAHLVGSIIC